jgi:hypothetical protein
MSTANQGLYEELKSKMDKFFSTATPEEIEKSFEGIDVQALLRTSSEMLVGSWTMSLHEAVGPLNTEPYCISEQMVETCQFSYYNAANNNTLALAA